MYPNGNEKEVGDGHIFLYVSLVDKLSSGSFVNAMLRFFIYDQIRDNYLTVLGLYFVTYLLRITYQLFRSYIYVTFSEMFNMDIYI